MHQAKNHAHLKVTYERKLLLSTLLCINSIDFEQNIFAEMQYIYYGNIEF